MHSIPALKSDVPAIRWNNFFFVVKSWSGNGSEVHMAKKILVVDDSMTARKLIKSALENTGIEILEAQDGNQGIDMLMQNPDVQLIFSDINMPWKNGLEMIEEIRGNASYSQIPICLLTTESSEEALDTAKRLGITAFLVKPVQKEQITTLVETILS